MKLRRRPTIGPVLQLAVALAAVALVSACNPSGGRGGSAPRQMDAGFLVGTGMASHDPVAPVCVGGGASLCGRIVDPAQPGAIRDTLLSRAMAITGVNGETFILVTTTNIGYFLSYKDGEGQGDGIYDMRLRIAEQTGVNSNNIVVVSDHSHNGPDTIGIWGGVDAAYKRITADAVVQAAVAAYQNREPATLKYAAINQNDKPVPGVPRLDSSYNTAPAYDESQGNPSNEFRVLVADAVSSGERILSFMNYAPHATVINGAATDQVSGDWAAWGPQEAELLYGGMGLAAVGSVGSTDWNKSGSDADEKEAEARTRLRLLLSTAQDQLQDVQGTDVQVESVFIRELITQPVLLLNYKPTAPTDTAGSPLQHYDVRIDRDLLPPFLTGTVFGTYVSGIRIGGLFLSTFPGEPFGELEYALQGGGGVQGPQAHFLLGAANDFFGYMVRRPETYQQTFQTGASWLAGCPEQEVYDGLGIAYDGACSDHWTLMVSPTIGTHIVCSLQDAAETLGFVSGARDQQCAVLTALDGQAAPVESTDAFSADPAARHSQNRASAQQLAAICAQQGAPATWCAAIDAATLGN